MTGCSLIEHPNLPASSYQRNNKHAVPPQTNATCSQGNTVVEPHISDSPDSKSIFIIETCVLCNMVKTESMRRTTVLPIIENIPTTRKA